MADLLTIHEAKGEKRANVVFVHGLGGDMRSTWMATPQLASFWPAWLAQDLEGLSVYSVGYEAPVSRWRGQAMHLTDRATNVLACLMAEAGLATGPFVLIGHSLGGLVIKQLLRTAESEATKREDAAGFLKRVGKVAFLATPHNGSDLATLGDRIGIFVRPSAATASLVRNDPNLRDLNLWYRDWANQHGIAHLILTESKTLHVLGIIVKPDSSDPGLKDRPIPTDYDHVAIAKPKDRTSDIYVQVQRFIESKIEQPRDLLPPIVQAQERIENKINQLPDEVVAKLVAELDKRGQTARATEAGLERETILNLANLLKPAEILDFDQAVKELENAVEIALDVIAKGKRGTNLEAFVADVLKQLAETTKIGDFEAGTKAVDDALAELDRRDEEHRQSSRRSRETLLEAGLEQDLLRRDAVGAAKRIEAIVALDSPADPIWSPAYRERFHVFYNEGTEKGVNLALEVAAEIARRMLTATHHPDRRGAALNMLGNALVMLGERESGSARLKEAVSAFCDALNQYTRDRMPLAWAMTQSNLGTALGRLANREPTTSRYEEAIGAFREVLKEYTREREPLLWAGAQTNLGNALRLFGEWQRNTARLKEAVACLQEALKEYTRARVPLSWAGTKSNLGLALQLIGEQENDTATLEQAIAVHHEALKEFTLERVPLNWAETTGGQGIALMLLAERRSDGEMAKQALEQIEVAFTTLRDGGHVPAAAIFEARLQKAQALVERLRKNGAE